ncbi:hypothetical protein ACHAXS_003486, partial [Conticribra weissflogii]
MLELNVCMGPVLVSSDPLVLHLSVVYNPEYVAMQTGVESLQGMQYELHTMGIAIHGNTHIYGD